MTNEQILEEARRRCDANKFNPHVGEYACACWDDEPEMLHEVAEVELETQSRRYQGNQFRDYRGRPIKIDEQLSLKDALDRLDVARRAASTAARHEAGVCGVREYEEAQATTEAARQAAKEAQANAEAAFYRATLRWPGDLYAMGLR